MTLQPKGFCPRCGYPIDPGRCSECGMDVPPDRLALTDRRVRLQRLFRWTRRLGVAAAVFALIWFGGGPLAALLCPTSVLIRLSEANGTRWTWPDEVIAERLVAGRLSQLELDRYIARFAPFKTEPSATAYFHDSQLVLSYFFEFGSRFARWGVGPVELISLKLDGRPLDVAGAEIPNGCGMVPSVMYAISPVDSTSGVFKLTYRYPVWTYGAGGRTHIAVMDADCSFTLKPTSDPMLFDVLIR